VTIAHLLTVMTVSMSRVTALMIVTATATTTEKRKMMTDDIVTRLLCNLCGMTVINNQNDIADHCYFHEEMWNVESKYSVILGYEQPIVFKRLSDD